MCAYICDMAGNLNMRSAPLSEFLNVPYSTANQKHDVQWLS